MGLKRKVVVTLSQEELEEILHEGKTITWCEKDFDIDIKSEDGRCQVYECDEELIKQSNGDKFFVSYANDTKIKTFRTRKRAEAFADKLNKEEETWDGV